MTQLKANRVQPGRDSKLKWFARHSPIDLASAYNQPNEWYVANER